MTETPDIELFTDDAPAPTIVDRSTLQTWADCPHQAVIIDRKMVSTSSTPADIGNAVHDIIAVAVTARHEEAARPSELREIITTAAANSRPDIQPQVVAAVRRCWPIVELICMHETGERSPDDILRYDSGKGEHSGQLAADVLPALDDGTRGAVRVTAEMDLLMASPVSAEELLLRDWKSGWLHWTATDVKDSFQFQTYVWLIFRNYPTCNRVNVAIFMTRDGALTAEVEFIRQRDFWTIQQRLVNAALTYVEHHETEDLEAVPAWPAPEKCSVCPAATLCKLAHAPAKTLATDPEAYLRQYLAVAAAENQMKRILTDAVRKRGQDFVFPPDLAFGINRPKESPKQPPCYLYIPRGVAAAAEAE